MNYCHGRKKKVTIILDALTMGGAEHMVYELSKNVDTSKFDICVLCYMKQTNSLLENQAKALLPIIYLGQSGHVTLGMIIRVVRALQKTKPDVVHGHMGGAAFGAIWSILFRKPLVITVHAKPEEEFTGKIEALVRISLRAGKTKLVAVSKENEAMVKDYYGLDNRKCGCVNNGIDLDRFHRKEHDVFTLINVARQDDNKNQAALIRCFTRLHKTVPNTKLLLLGDGANHEALKQQAAELGLTDAIVFTGNVSNTEDYYAISDLYVQCSFQEAMPLSVLEAMAAGLPVVSTRVGGLVDVVQDNGILVPAGDETALYDAILSVYRMSKEKRAAMAQASQQLVQAYSAESMARSYESIYAEMCK